MMMKTPEVSKTKQHYVDFFTLRLAFFQAGRHFTRA